MRILENRGNWYKGNLHMHTTVSDGELDPVEAISVYREAGYDFIAITDHRKVGHLWQDDSFLIGPAAVAKMLEAASGTEALHADFPSPMLLYHAMRYLNATAEITVFAAADARREIPAAEAAGIRSVLVTSAGDENTDLFDLSSKPDYVVETLAGLLR